MTATLPTLFLRLVAAMLVSAVPVTARTAEGPAGAGPAALPHNNASSMVPYRINGDSIDAPLTAESGSAVRGRAIVANRQQGLCLLCHVGPVPEERFQGNLAPDLAGAGSRWSAGQLRLRIVDARRLNPDTIMPAYYRVEGLTRVQPALSGKPIFSAQQVEDVVAYLQTLRAPEETATGTFSSPGSPPAAPARASESATPR